VKVGTGVANQLGIPVNDGADDAVVLGRPMPSLSGFDKGGFSVAGWGWFRDQWLLQCSWGDRLLKVAISLLVFVPRLDHPNLPHRRVKPGKSIRLPLSESQRLPPVAQP